MRTNVNAAGSAALVAAIALAGCSREATAPAVATNSGPALTAQNSVAGAPPSWSIAPNPPASFTYGLESATAHGGTHAAFIANSGPAVAGSTYVEIFQLVRADSYVGHRVRLSGWCGQPMFSCCSRRTTVLFRIPVSLCASTAAIPSSRSTACKVVPVVATTDWHQVFVVLDVPSNAVGILSARLFRAAASCSWMTSRSIQVDVSVPTTTNVIDDPRPMPNIGARYQNAPLTPLNLDFETVVEASASSSRTTRVSQSAVRNHRSGQ